MERNLKRLLGIVMIVSCIICFSEWADASSYQDTNTLMDRGYITENLSFSSGFGAINRTSPQRPTRPSRDTSNSTHHNKRHYHHKNHNDSCEDSCEQHHGDRDCNSDNTEKSQ